MLSKVTSQSTKALSNKVSSLSVGKQLCLISKDWRRNFWVYHFFYQMRVWLSFNLLQTNALLSKISMSERHLDVKSERRRERKFTHRPDSKGSDSHFPPYRWILWPASSLRCLLLSGSASTWVLVKPVLMSGMRLPPFLASILSSFVLAGEYEPPTF